MRSLFRRRSLRSVALHRAGSGSLFPLRALLDAGLSRRPATLPTVLAAVLAAALLLNSGTAARAGNWKAVILFSGSGSTSVSPLMNPPGGNYLPNTLQTINEPFNQNYSLATLANSPANTQSGGITGSMFAVLGENGPSTGTRGESMGCGGSMIIQLTWQPANGDAAADPPPATVPVFFRRRATAAVSMTGYDPKTNGASISAGASVDGLSVPTQSLTNNNTSLNAAVADPGWTELAISGSGVSISRASHSTGRSLKV
jgi:hypothetical protein